MALLPDPRPTFSPEARAIYDEIIGPRGHDYPGMYRDLMNYPELARRFGQLGAILRFEGPAPPDVREIAILATARALRAPYIWDTHLEPAAKAGITGDVIEDLLEGEDCSRHKPIYGPVTRLVMTFLNLEAIPDSLQEELVREVGLEGFLQISVIVNFYRMVAGLAYGFEFPLPEGMTDPFKTVGGPVAS
jgi:4-carboxymuconolactone decarboxylase